MCLGGNPTSTFRIATNATVYVRSIQQYQSLEEDSVSACVYRCEGWWCVFVCIGVYLYVCVWTYTLSEVLFSIGICPKQACKGCGVCIPHNQIKGII